MSFCLAMRKRKSVNPISVYLTGTKFMQCKATPEQFFCGYYGESSTAKRHDPQMYQEKKEQ